MTTPLWKRIIARILEALLAIIFISPLVWVIICSFSPQAGSAQSKGWGVANYLTLFGYQEGLPKYLFNSVIVTLVAVVFSVVVCTLAGYSFSRFDYPGRNLGFMVTLSILMVPYASLLIPLVPGRPLYYAMYYAVQQDMDLSADFARQTALYALGIALGASLVWALADMRRHLKQNGFGN